jgi:hypothetical protein
VEFLPAALIASAAGESARRGRLDDLQAILNAIGTGEYVIFFTA